MPAKKKQKESKVTLIIINDYEIINKAKQGDKNAMELLLKMNAGLIKKLASYYFYHLKVTHLEFDELVTEGQIGFINAVKRFDTTKGYKLSTYVTYGIKNSILNALRESSIIKYSTRDVMKQMKKNKENKEESKTVLFSLDLIGSSEDMEICSHYAKKLNNISSESDVENFVIDKMDQQAKYVNLKKMLNKLTNEEKKVIYDYFGFDNEKLNLKEISKKHNLPYSYVRTVKCSAMEKLKKFQ